MDGKTAKNLCKALSGSAVAHHRYLYFARKADNGGFEGIGSVFRSTAEGERDHALGHLALLWEMGRSGVTPFGVRDYLRSAIEEEGRCADLYPLLAHEARAEGCTAIASWFEELAGAERAHARRFLKLLHDES